MINQFLWIKIIKIIKIDSPYILFIINKNKQDERQRNRIQQQD